MCTAATYKTKDFYFGRTLDYEFSYGDEVTITPRNFEFKFREVDDIKSSLCDNWRHLLLKIIHYITMQ